MRKFMFAVLSFAVKHLTRWRDCFAPPVPVRLYRVLQGYRRQSAVEDILKNPVWTTQEILENEG